MRRHCGPIILVIAGACVTPAPLPFEPAPVPPVVAPPITAPPPLVFDIGTPPKPTACLPIGERANPRAGLDDRWGRYPSARLTRPMVGKVFSDPVFGTNLRRITDRMRRARDTYEVPVYAQVQSISADGVHLLTTTEEGYQLRCLATGERSATSITHVNVPRWHPTLPHLIVHFDTNVDDVVRVQTTNVTTGEVTTTATLAEYRRVIGSPSFESLSLDGRWLSAIGRTQGGLHEIFTYDLLNKRFGAQLDTSAMFESQCKLPLDAKGRKPEKLPMPEWVSPSPLGDLLVVQWPLEGAEPCRGLETYDIANGAFVGRVHRGRPRGDLGVVPSWWTAPSDQRQFFMAIEGRIGIVDASVVLRFLPGSPTAVASPQILLPLDAGTRGHVSCVGPSGQCLVSTGHDGAKAGDNGDWAPFANEVFIAGVDRTVRRLAHHRSSYCGYWAEARATWSSDGRFVVFSSDWGENACHQTRDGVGRADTYVIDLTK